VRAGEGACRIVGREHKYEIIVYWSEADNVYIAEVPELAGCMADGKTYTEAVQNAEVVISEWIETALLLGRKIPVPHGVPGTAGEASGR
jgi:predicted RNase H-like HicB family nuclease